MNPNHEQIVIKASKWVNNGYCLGYFGDQTFFISGAIPGELVSCRIVHQSAKFKHLVVDEIIEGSPSRIESDCPIFLKCGGCSFRHISYEDELELKKELLQNQLYSEKEFPIHYNKPANYRNNVQLKISNYTKGFYKHHSNQIVEFPNTGCQNLADSLNHYIISYTPQTPNQNLKLRYNGKSVIRYDKKVTRLKIKDSYLQIPPNGFWQINRFLVEDWLDRILEIFNNDYKTTNLLELFSGCGLLSLFCSFYFQKITAYELDAVSIEYAKINSKSKKVQNVNFIQKDLYRQKIHQEHGRSPIWLANPPRNGLGKLLLQQIEYYKPKKILYSSCNYISLSLELNFLRKIGYHVSHISAFDFFPRTPYVETLVVFELV